MDEDRLVEFRLGLQLSEQAIDVVDVPGPLDLGHHDHLEAIADRAHDFGQVVEHPRRLQRVDARPQRGAAQLHNAADLDQPGACGLLAVDRHGVLEVAEQDVDRRRDVGHLGDHLLVGEVQEVDHPRGLEGNLARRFGRADREGLVEGSGIAQVSLSWVLPWSWGKERYRLTG